ncbi:MAG: hypothetical protein N2Z23_03425 [Pyrinomonadaceae bacterium]|nr:hypothetical protein [Pyrinomonadaceae bacterium]MCX7639478.1 hypothetical protein [Pyrinomonadaceae bacterium]MDW8304471.1 hypothetical protein [Acidobacteriota bacterium]
MKKRAVSLLSIIAVVISFAVGLKAQQINEREVRDILRQLSVKLGDLRYNLDYEVRQRGVTRSDETRLLQSFSELQNQLEDFQRKFDRRRDSQYEVSNLLLKAKVFNEELANFRVSFTVSRDWDSAKTLFDRLAAIYGVPSDWQTTRGRTTVTGNFRFSLNGSYSLDQNRSDDVREVADRAVKDTDVQDKVAASRDIEILLEPPQNLAIEIRGNRVTLESTLAPQITITADGRERTETLSDGRMLRIRATLRGQQELTINSFGDDSDYSVTFLLTEGGRALRVTRSATLYYLGKTVSAESFYFKTDSVARFGIYDRNYQDRTSWSDSRNGGKRQFIVPNGTIITGTLENEISTKTSKNYDRFSLTVVAPTQFRGAVIEGYVSNVSRSGRISGRPQIVFNFEKIRMPNGEVYDFRGTLISATDAEGKTVKTDPEGTAKGGSQTNEAVKRGAIGSALGAIIGAVAGGAKGAAIGAAIGASIGAGSVVVQGKDDLEFKAGSTLMIQSSSPNSNR